MPSKNRVICVWLGGWRRQEQERELEAARVAKHDDIISMIRIASPIIKDIVKITEQNLDEKFAKINTLGSLLKTISIEYNKYKEKFRADRELDNR